ncbi:MAG: hypothetical protein ACOYMZ_01825 [Minisyncoccia bacterium]
MKTAVHYAKTLPTVGGVIYVPPVHHVKVDDHRTGGKVTVRRIEAGENGNGPTHFIIVEEFPQRIYQYDWYYISRKQDYYKELYGDTFACFE